MNNSNIDSNLKLYKNLIIQQLYINKVLAKYFINLLIIITSLLKHIGKCSLNNDFDCIFSYVYKYLVIIIKLERQKNIIVMPSKLINQNIDLKSNYQAIKLISDGLKMKNINIILAGLADTLGFIRGNSNSALLLFNNDKVFTKMLGNIYSKIFKKSSYLLSNIYKLYL